MCYYFSENWRNSGTLTRKQSEEEKKSTDGRKHENIGNKREKLNKIGNIEGFVNI